MNITLPNIQEDIMCKFGLSLLAAAAFFSMASSAHADLTGDTVDVQYLYPNISTTVADVGNAVVPGSVFYTPGGGTMEITVTGNLVTITNNGTGVDFQTPAGANPFNGFSVSDLTQNPGIVGVTFLQGASTVPSNFLSGPGAEVTTYTSNEVFFNFAGENWCNCTDFTAEFQLVFGTGNNNVPEPPTVALLGAGLVGLGLFVARRRKSRNERNAATA
jgi:hypothetical protein